MTTSARRMLAVGTALGIFVADRWTKAAVDARVAPTDTVAVIPGLFNIIHSENAGVAFGMFSESASRARTPALVLLSLVAVVLLGWLLWRIDRVDSRSGAGLALILGGALGNVYDRVSTGVVTDFLDFYMRDYHWYTFNLADTAICTGAGLLMLSMLFPHGVQREQRA